MDLRTATRRTGPGAVYLPAIGRYVPIAVYVDGVRRAIAQPSATFRHGLAEWWPVTGEAVRCEFRRAMAARINARVPGYGCGRKWTDDWQRAARRVAGDMAARVIVRERDCPPDLRARLAGRLYTESDL